jgi:Na+/melibiose symporter-like transporter
MIYASGVFFSVVFISSGDLLAFFIICLLSGFALSADLAIPSSIQADLIDIETVKGGKRRTATFFSVWSIATKGSIAISSGLAILILSYFHFDVVGNNSRISLGVLTALYAIAPIILKLFAIFLMWNFGLNKKYQQKIQKSLIEDV